jgi:glutathione synthase/RimK-type ligase-like ATP-grasp enzyme
MAKKDVYIYYSGATDVTGKKLQEALDITGGTTKPKTAKKLIIGWGAKTKDSVNLGKTTVLNHPDKIRDNRNKFKTLQALRNANVKVADFVKSSDVITAIGNNNSINLPLIGRTNFHQGGKGFWLCLTKHQINDAIHKGAQYFQNYLSIKDEFRLHIFEDELLYAVKKVQRSNIAEAFKEQHGDKIRTSAQKGNKELDNGTVDYVLEKLAGRLQPDPDMIVRSNMRGWKFSHVKTIDNALKEEAIKSLKAIGLTFGAVDCCIDEDGNPWIIEINSGPGLDGTPFKAYVDMFTAKIDEILNPALATKSKAKKVAIKATVKDDSSDKSSAKARLKAKTDFMTELVENANEAEATVLEGLFSKMAGG